MSVNEFIEPIHKDYQDLFLRLFEGHKKELHETIDQHVVGNAEGMSYVSESQVSEMLGEHFSKIENLVEEHVAKEEKGVSISDFFNRLKKGMSEKVTEFKDSLADRVEKTKVGFNEKVQDVKNGARRQVNTFVDKINSRIKKLSNKLDNFVEVSSSENEFEYMDDVDLITFLETDGILKDGLYFNTHGEQGIKEMVRGFGYEPSEASVIYNDLGDEYAINVNTGVYDDKGTEKGTGVEILVDKESGKASIYELEVYDKDPNFSPDQHVSIENDPNVMVDEKKVDGELQLFVDAQYLEGKNLSKSNAKNRNVEFDYGL